MTDRSMGGMPKLLAKVERGKVRRSRSPAARAMRRGQIVDAAAQTFAKLGYAEAEMEEIAERIGIAKGTLYLYFDSKQELFFACVDEGMKRLYRRAAEATASVVDPFEKIAIGVETYLAFFDDNAHFVELFIQERASFRDSRRATYFEHRERNLAPWRDLYAKLAAAGEIRQDIPSDQLLEAASNLLFGAMYTNRIKGRAIPVVEQARILTQFIFAGLKANR